MIDTRYNTITFISLIYYIYGGNLVYYTMFIINVQMQGEAPKKNVIFWKVAQLGSSLALKSESLNRASIDINFGLSFARRYMCSVKLRYSANSPESASRSDTLLHKLEAVEDFRVYMQDSASSRNELY